MARTRKHRIETAMNEEEYEKYKQLVIKSKLNQQNYNLKCLLNKNISKRKKIDV